MKNLYLLDCTLRDGGYINNWNFGFNTIQSILQKLCISNVEYIECGYLSQKKETDENYTQYRDFDAVQRVLPQGFKNHRFAVMIDYGKYNIHDIPDADPEKPIIIRVCFHKKDAEDALSFCSKLMDKGYTVFIQAMASLNYSDVEYLELIRKVNEMNPACFYIVDSFGVIEIEDFQRLLFLTDHNLKPGIMLGYHAHNNLQQAYGNAKYMVEQNLTHDILIDASVYGMGRGAGNLNMELFASYLNKNYDKTYNIDAFLDIMDQYLKPIFVDHYWGYSLPFYLSAKYNCHPNYAGYFADKNTLSNRSIRQLLASLPADVKNHYSESLAEKYYQEYQEQYVDDSDALKTIKEIIGEKDVLILAPGKSLDLQREKIHAFIQEKQPVIIAINVIPVGYKTDLVFCANEKRVSALTNHRSGRIILSSNITGEFDALKVNYASYLSENGDITDNPTLMMIRLLMSINVSEISLAGFDGYSAVAEENYFDKSLSLGTSLSLKVKRNTLIKDEIRKLRESVSIHFITDSKYE